MKIKILNIIWLSLIIAGCQSASINPKPLTKDAPINVLQEKTIAPQDYEIRPTRISFDHNTGEITYTITKDALVRVRIGMMDGGPMIATPVDWEFRKKGRHVEKWDFMADGGQVNYRKDKNLSAVVMCVRPDRDIEALRKNKIFKGWRNAPRIKITFPTVEERTKEGYPIIRGIVPLRISIHPDDAVWANQTKYEMSLFVDNIFLMEDEEGVNPFNYQFNVKGFSNGIRTITANMVGYEGDVGTVSVNVMVDN